MLTLIGNENGVEVDENITLREFSVRTVGTLTGRILQGHKHNPITELPKQPVPLSYQKVLQKLVDCFVDSGTVPNDTSYVMPLLTYGDLRELVEEKKKLETVTVSLDTNKSEWTVLDYNKEEETWWD